MADIAAENAERMASGEMNLCSFIAKASVELVSSWGRTCYLREEHAGIMMKMYHISRFAVMIATNATMLMRDWNEA